MTIPHRDNRLKAILCVLSGVGLASGQDAIVKVMSSGYPAYETLMFRCVGSVPVLVALLWYQGALGKLMTPHWRRVVLRGVILGLAYLCFVLAIAAMPIADAVAIYFTMPFFVAGLAGPMLGEHVRIHRWLAIIAGFVGVIIMVRPGATVFEPASIFALLSAFGYATGQMISRPISHLVQPVIIATWQNGIYFIIGLGLAILFNFGIVGDYSHPSLVFLSRSFVMPSVIDAAILLAHGVLAGSAMMFYVNAYKYGEANFVAPFEYSAMIWAVLYGLTLFGHFPGIHTLTGAAIVIAAGIMMIWRDRILDRSTG